jgi:membrane fusion protein, multidrug efflux system
MKSRTFFLIIILMVAGVLTWRFAVKRSPAPKSAAANAGVAVVEGEVARRDVPIWLSGLGTVQASNTVTVHPRVNGPLDQVNFTEGQLVKAGDVLAKIDARPYASVLQQALAKKAQDEAQLANAQLDRDRFRQLVESNAESRRVLDQQEAAVRQYTALVQASQAAVEAAQLDLDFTTVRSPIAGRTGVRLIDAGNLISAGQTSGIVVVAQLQPVSVLFALPQQNLPALQRRFRADPSQLKVQALAEDGTVLAEGKLELIDNQIDSATGTLKLKATFPNEDLSLWPGQFVSTRVLVETRQQALVVPTQVVQAGLDGPFAYAVKTDRTVDARPLKTGPVVGGFTVIEQGLQAGETVVVDGQSKLQPGAKVTPAPAPAAVASRKTAAPSATATPLAQVAP